VTGVDVAALRRVLAERPWSTVVGSDLRSALPALLDAAEAVDEAAEALSRVRALHRRLEPSASACLCGKPYPCPTLDAIEGTPTPGEFCGTCQGWDPITGVRFRETTNLVCQSCGRDYGAAIEGAPAEQREALPQPDPDGGLDLTDEEHARFLAAAKGDPEANETWAKNPTIRTSSTNPPSTEGPERWQANDG
jgi:hypothetical protein